MQQARLRGSCLHHLHPSQQTWAKKWLMSVTKSCGVGGWEQGCERQAQVKAKGRAGVYAEMVGQLNCCSNTMPPSLYWTAMVPSTAVSGVCRHIPCSTHTRLDHEEAGQRGHTHHLAGVTLHLQEVWGRAEV